MNGLYLDSYVFLKITVTFFVIITLSACKRELNQSAHLKDSDLTIEVMRLQSDGDDSVSSYKARIIPQKMLLDGKTQDDKDALIYRMDSCFYILSGTQKIYASLVQPIANGVSGSFEYLLQFANTVGSSDNLNMVYQDKYLNRRKYSLKLNSDNL